MACQKAKVPGDTFIMQFQGKWLCVNKEISEIYSRCMFHFCG